MKIQELLSEIGIGDLIKTAIASNMQSNPPKNQNANAVPKSSVQPIGAKTPQQYSTSAGSTTPQDGVPKLPTSDQSAGGDSNAAASQNVKVDPSKISPNMVQTLFKPGQEINLGSGNKAKIKSVNPQGIKVDATQIPAVDSDITISPQDLFKS